MLQGGKILKNYQGVYRVVITLKSMTHKMCRGHIWGPRIAQWWSAGHVIKRLQVWVPAVSRIFFPGTSQLFVLTLTFSIHSIPMLLQLHDKLNDPSHSAKSTHGRLYLNTQVYTITEFVKCLGRCSKIKYLLFLLFNGHCHTKKVTLTRVKLQWVF